MLEVQINKRILHIAGEKVEISKELFRWIYENTNTQVMFNLIIGD